MSRRPDWLVAQLPGGMLDDDFLVRFLGIFQSMGQTYLDHIDNLELAFDPTVTPTPMVRVLGQWIGLDYLDPELPDDVQRRLVRRYSSLIAWRGTARGLRELLEAITDAPVQVSDDGTVVVTPPPTENEWEEPPRGLRSHVRVSVAEAGWASDDDLVRIVQRELPATVTFELRRGDRLLWPAVEEDAA